MSIETSTRCSCGAYVVVGKCEHINGWFAMCMDCYEPTDDPREEVTIEAANVLGRGPTPDAALWDWQEQHDDAWDVEWLPADMFGDLARQVSEERERQRGWEFEWGGIIFHAGTTLDEVQQCVADEGFAPEHRGEIEYGPREAA